MPYRLVFVILPLALATGWLIWRATRPPTFTSVPRAVTIAAACLTGLLCVQQGWMEYRWVSTERALTAAISEIAGPNASIHCQRWTEALFYAWNARGRVEMRPDGSADETAMLTYETCQEIRNWLASDRAHPTVEQVTALHIATHEAVHLTGEFNEATTECAAMRADAALFERMGMPADVARRASEQYLAEVYPHIAPDYRTEHCERRTLS